MTRLLSLIPMLTGSIALLCTSVQAQTTYTWTNQSEFWSVGEYWQGGVAPSGTNSTDILRFTGDVLISGSYSANNDIFPAPFLFNRLLLENTNSGAGNPINILEGNALRLTGVAPQIVQNGTVGFAIENNLHFTGSVLPIGGTGTGSVALRGTLTGIGNIVKSGPGGLSFGNKSATPFATSENTWMGSLILQGGNVVIESNRAAAGALRANPIIFENNSTVSFRRVGTEAIGASLRFGNLQGSVGTVEATVQPDLLNYNVVLTLLSQTSFGGTLIAPTPGNASNDPGELVFRGVGSQTFTGTVRAFKDVVIGSGTTVTLGGSASLNDQTQGAISMTGGVFNLDNTAGNTAAGRLRNGARDSTGLETLGGGTFRLIGADNGTSEIVGRLQLGAYSSAASSSTRRSGQLRIEVVHRSVSASTDLNFQSYSRDEQTLKQYATIDFSAKDANGNSIALGQPGLGAHIRLTSSPLLLPPPTSNGLLMTTVGTPKSVGWATVNGTDFAGYSIISGTDYGVIPVVSTLWTPTTAPAATANARIEETVTAPAAYVVNSIKMAPVAIDQSLNISGSTPLSSTAFLLAGGIDFAIKNAVGSTTGIGGVSTRFFYVQQATLTVEPSLNGATQSIVKSGAGTLVLKNNANVGLSNSLVHTSINDGILRATPGSTLPNAEVKLRGGQLEIVGGGLRTMTLGPGTGGINWSTSLEDMGSGGLAAIGGDLTFSLVLPAGNPLQLSWEDAGFVQSNYELVFGSKSSDSMLNWTRPFSLTEAGVNTPYAARTIRVLDNPNSTTDFTRLSGSITGAKQNDLVKTGPGILELTASNTYAGATIIHEGTLLVNSTSNSNKSSFLHDVRSGGTLGGNGSVGATQVAGKIAPGALAGRTEMLNVVGDLTFLGNTSQFLLEIGGSAAASPTSGYDRLNVTGTLTLGNADLVGSFVNGFTGFAEGTTDTLFLILNDGTDAIQGQFSDGSLFSIGNQHFAISYNADFDTQQFTTPTGNDVAIQLVPEPSSAILLGLGALFVSRRRR